VLINQADLTENDIIAIGNATFRLVGGELIEYVDDGRATFTPCHGLRSDPQPVQFAVRGPAVRRGPVGSDHSGSRFLAASRALLRRVVRPRIVLTAR
jgi:hypothetical protein